MDSDLDRVKSILLGEEYAELIELKNEIKNSEAFAEAVSDVLAEALETRAARDNRVADVLAPTIDQAIAGSIDQDPKKLAESLYPIMGPAIRKSISETLQQMLENFNQLLEQSLSPKSVGWRFTAWRTGRSYSELVLLNTLEYEVEQVFLIHQETSLLMQHVYSDLAEKKDPDMVSSMFSAIQDFIEDSFSINEDDVLDTLRLGELSVVIQRGPLAVVAAVVRGNIPENLRESLQNVSELIHRKKRAQLVEYSGDPTDFLDVEGDLRSILAFKQKQEEKERSIPWLAIVTIVIVAGVAGYYSYLEQLKRQVRQSIVAAVDATPGVVVLSDDFQGETHVLTVLQDPLAEDVSPLLQPASAESAASEIIAYTYLSADDEIVSQRIERQIAPPDSVTVSVDKGRVYLTGEATVQWFSAIEAKIPLITGVERLDFSSLVLRDPVAEEFDRLNQNVEAFKYTFEKEASELDPDDARIGLIAEGMTRLISLAEKYQGERVHFHLVGYTDQSGTVRLNRRIGKERAENLMEILILQKVPADVMSAHSSFDYHTETIPASREVRIYLAD